jgi:DNA-binding response OmpR family regulator
MQKLLFIHPEPKLVGVYKRHLSNYFSFDSAFDGLQGLRMIQTFKPQIILSDYHLPNVTGTALLQFVRQDRDLHSTPFIFLSHSKPVSDVLGLGANDWIVISETNPDLVISKCFDHLKLAFKVK